MKARIIWALLVAGQISEAASAGRTCTPGVNTCDGVPLLERMPHQSVPAKIAATAMTAGTPCSTPGTYSVPSGLEDVDDVVFVVNADLTGTFHHPWCVTAPLTTTQTGINTFHMRVQALPDPICDSVTLDMTHATDCATASGIAINDRYPDYAMELTITRLDSTGLRPGKVMIPANARIESPRDRRKRFLLTESQVAATVITNGQPVAGVTVALQSDRPTKDSIVGPSAQTNTQGTTLAKVQTRDQTSSSTITMVLPTSASGKNTRIDWLPAEYEAAMQITCYVVSQEGLFPTTGKVAATGLPAGSPNYNEVFLRDVRMQGSGLTTDGRYLRYDPDSRSYVYDTCARTASGQCAVDGTTAAVDPEYIPFRSTINIDGVGERSSVDTGGAIKGGHIDVFYGVRRTECKAWGSHHYLPVSVLDQPWRVQ